MQYAVVVLCSTSGGSMCYETGNTKANCTKRITSGSYQVLATTTTIIRMGIVDV